MIAAELLTRLGFKVDKAGLEEGKSTLQGFKSWVVKLGIGAALFAAGKSAVQTAAELESMTATFETLLRSGTAAESLMSRIKKHAAATSFDTGDIGGMMSQLMQATMTTEEAWGTMKRLGDVAGSNKEKFRLLGYAMSQIHNAGKLQGQDLNQLINSGWNPLQAISQRTGKTQGELRKEMEKGAITAKMVEQALIDVTSAGGMFEGNQKRQAKSLSGIWNSMIENLKYRAADMVMAFSPVLKQLMSWVANIDMTPLISAFKWLADAVNYVAMVMWNSGLAEAWFVFTEAIADFQKQLGDSTAPNKFGSVLVVLGRLLGWVASAILLAASTLLTWYGYLLKVAEFLWEWRDAFVTSVLLEMI